MRASCVAQYGHACDWDAALKAAAHGCDEQLEQHWSAVVRQKCEGQVPDEHLRFGLLDVHFPERERAEGSAALARELDPLEQHPERLRPFEFPARSSGESSLSSAREVSVVVATRLGVLVGLDAGEWGGGLVWLPERGEPSLLFRAPVSYVFEHRGEVYVVARDSADRGELYHLRRTGPAHASRWSLELRFRLPGRPKSAWANAEQVLLETDAGFVVVRDLDDVRTLPAPPSPPDSDLPSTGAE